MEANSAQKGEERQAQTEETTCPTNVTQMSGADLTVKSPKTVWKENRAVSTCENSLHTYWSLACAKCLLYIQLCKKNRHQTSPFTVTSSLRAETGLDSIPKLPWYPLWSGPCARHRGAGIMRLCPVLKDTVSKWKIATEHVLCYRWRKDKGCGCQRPSITRLWENRKASRKRWHLSWILRLSRSQTGEKEGKEGPSRRFCLSNVCITAITIIIPTLIEHLTMCQSLYLSTYTSINSFHPHKNLLRSLQLLFLFYR